MTHPHHETAVALAELLNAGVNTYDALKRLDIDPVDVYSEDDSVFSIDDPHNDIIDFGWCDGELVIVHRWNNLWHPETTTRLTKGGA